MDLTLTTRDAGGKTIVAVGGEIDVYTAPKLRDKIPELVAGGVYDIVIDMEEVEFLDSTGLGVLVGGLKKVRAHDGSLQLVCNQDRLLKIFRITGLAKVFVIHDSADAALAGNVRAQLVERFYPSAADWRRNVLSASEKIYAQAIAGLAGWVRT